MPTSPDSELPLPDAALRLQLSRERALRLLLSGVLTGGRRGTRWFVTSNSIDAFLKAGPQAIER